MKRSRLFLLATCVVLSSQALAQESLPASLEHARALLTAGQIEAAIDTAERYTGMHPKDERGFLVLGDAYFKRMPVGRFQAERAYREAMRLAPNDPVPPFKVAEVGLWLGGDDGEHMAQEGLERVLCLDPLYPEAWDDWLTLFRNSGYRQRMREILAPHANVPVIRSRIALLNIEDERYAAADSLLDEALVTDSTNVEWLALRAQSAFEAGDTLGGWAYYRRALAHADLDSTDALWRQVIGIASPEEIKVWDAGVPPDEKEAWLEAFWARRNPDLFAGVNHRVAEHFARLRYARKHFPLMHPLVSYQRSEIGRAMNLEPSQGERAFYERCEMYEVLVPPHLHPAYPGINCGVDPECKAHAMGVPLPGVSRASDRARINPSPFAILTPQEMAHISVAAGLLQSLFAPLNMNLLSVDSVAARIGYNLATGLDDRGVMYLRFGAPDQRDLGGTNTADPQCSNREVERWHYPDYGWVRFDRPDAFSGGLQTVPDMVFRPMNERQFALVKRGLTEDHSSEPAPLDFGVWTAQLMDTARFGVTDLVVVSTRGMIAASLTGLDRPGDRWIGTHGWVSIPARPGSYLLLAQAEDSGRLGRQTLPRTVRPFVRFPAVSEMLLAPAWREQGTSREVTRAAMLSHLARTLTFATGSTIRSYVEVYGLAADSFAVRYQVTYELLKSDHPEADIQRRAWPGATRLQFQRERPEASHGVEIEMLDIIPAQVPPGRYLLRVSVHDLVSGRDAGAATVAFAVR